MLKTKKNPRNFTQKILGFRKRDDKGLWIEIDSGQYIHLTENSGDPVSGTFYHLAREVDDLSAYMEKLKLKGIDIFDFSGGKLQNFIRDIDGNLIELIDSKDNFFK